MGPVRVASLAVVLMLGSAGGSMAQMVVGPANSGVVQSPCPATFPIQIPCLLSGRMPGARD